MIQAGNDLATLRRARRLLDRIFALVEPHCLYHRPIPARHRIAFYVGHVEAFDQNLITGWAGIGAEPFAPELDRLFAFGIDPPAGMLPSDQPEDWPERERIWEYCTRVREHVDHVWQKVPEQLRYVSIEHRLMHAETLAYMLHSADLRQLVPVHEPQPAAAGRQTGESAWLAVPAGRAVLGKHRNKGFGWDNEFDEVVQQVGGFHMQRHKVSNGEYLRYVQAGADPPHFWRVGQDGEWLLRRMFDVVPLPLDWPVWVTHHQAQSYAQWIGAELPSEPQWHRAAWGDGTCLYPWGNEAPDDTRANVDSRRFSPVPVDSHPASASPFGVEDMIGNGWEWTSTPFRPFPGFEPFPFYTNYSAPFFDDDHYVMKGGSPRTDATFLRRSFRNWFRSDYPYVFAAFRCIRPL